MAEDNLSNLPAEILYQIFHYCDARTILCNIRRTCKRLRNVVKHYNQIQLNFSSISTWRFLRSIPVHKISSMTISWGNQYIFEDEMRPFICYINRFSQVRSLIISCSSDRYLLFVFKHLNYTQLVSLTINSKDQPSYEAYGEFVSWIGRSNLRKLYWPQLKYNINRMSWFDQCQLTDLTINSCPYNQFYIILQQLSCLKTFNLNCFSDTNDTVSSTPFASSLTCLNIKEFTLPSQQLKLLLSTAPKLRHLSIGFPELFQKNCFIDIYDCENFIRTELNFLDRLEFYYYYELPQNTMPSFDSILAPFRESFWLNEKHWSVDCGCILRTLYRDKKNYMVVFTASNTLDIFDPKNDTDAVLFKKSECYLLKREKNHPITIVPCGTVVELKFWCNDINSIKAKYLAYGLINNQTLTTLDLTLNHLGANGLKFILDALRNNPTFKTLNVYGNDIGDEGVQHMSDFLQNNKTFTTLNLSANHITSVGAEHLAKALLNNTALTKLIFNQNDIGETGVDHLAQSLCTNKTLTELHMKDSNITFPKMKLFCKALQNNSVTLKEINLDGNKFGDDGAKCLAQVLENNNAALENIQVTSNDIGDEGAHHLALALRHNRTVKTLNLTHNKIGTRGAESLLNELEHNTTLTNLRVQCNLDSYCDAVALYVNMKNNSSSTEISNYVSIGDKGAKFVADMMRNNTTVQKLKLTHSGIGTDGAKYLADALRGNTTLKVLDLEKNWIDDEGVCYVKETLKNNKPTLTTLILYNQNSHFDTRQGTANEIQKVVEKICKNDELLIELKLSHRYFCKSKFPSVAAMRIAAALRRNTTLKTLHIDAYKFGQRNLKYFIQEFQNQTTRVALYLPNVSMKKMLCIDIINQIQTDQTLAELEIKHEAIDMNGIVYLCHTISYHSSITTLNIIDNQLPPYAVIYVANVIRNNTTLATLCFEKNPIDENGMQRLASALKNNQTLKTLTLSNNRLDTNSVKSLLDALQINSTLTTLKIKNNRIGNDGASLIANFLLTNNTLLKLNLETNQIQAEGFEHIAKALEKNKTLIILEAASNNIGSEGTRHLSHALTINKTIKEMYLFNNRIRDKGAQHLIDLLQNNNVTFTKLPVEFNRISQQMKTRLNELLQAKAMH